MLYLGRFVRAGPHETQGLSLSTGRTPAAYLGLLVSTFGSHSGLA